MTAGRIQADASRTIASSYVVMIRKRALALAILACVLVGAFGMTARAYAYPPASAQADRVDASINMGMPLPGESIEWLMSSGAVGYQQAGIDFEILDISGVDSDLNQRVSIDLLQGDGSVIATGMSLRQLADWSFTCLRPSAAGCSLKAVLHLDAGAGDEMRNRWLHIRWMFTVQEAADGEAIAEGPVWSLASTGAPYLVFVWTASLLTVTGVALASLRRRASRKEVRHKNIP